MSVDAASVDAAKLLADAEAAYEEAVARAVYAREEWVEFGSVLTTELPNGIMAMDARLKVLMECEEQAARRLKLVFELSRKRHRGPAVGAVIDAPKPARLKSVG